MHSLRFVRPSTLQKDRGTVSPDQGKRDSIPDSTIRAIWTCNSPHTSVAGVGLSVCCARISERPTGPVLSSPCYPNVSSKCWDPEELRVFGSTNSLCPIASNGHSMNASDQMNKMKWEISQIK